MDFKQIQDLIKIVNKSDLSELKVEQDNFKITIRKQGAVEVREAPQASPPPPAKVPQTQPEPAPTQQAETPSPAESRLITIKSPMIGTFYRAAGPDKEPFVKVGDVISKGDHICIIEAMKLFNEIESEIDGKIVKVLAEDASPVEYDQPIFQIDPTGV